MAITPLLMLLDERVLRPRLDHADVHRPDEPDADASPVIIAGFGRAGQVVARILRARGVPFTALERDPDHLDFVRRFGSKVYFGDAGHSEVLRAAGAERARLMVLTVGDPEESARVARVVRKQFPQLPVFATARNRQHALLLKELCVLFGIRETFASSLELAEAVLGGLGVEAGQASRAVQLFREHDEQTLERQYAFRQDQDALVQSSREAADELRLLIESDEELAADTPA
jgi:voltage-gated potassium channel Kch